MGRRQSRALPPPALALTLLLMVAPAARAMLPLERSTAFIGYSEAGAGAGGLDGAAGGAAGALGAAPFGPCRDRRESCEGDASSDGCLVNPYIMRRMCPISCAVEPCVSSGASAKVRSACMRYCSFCAVAVCAPPASAHAYMYAERPKDTTK